MRKLLFAGIFIFYFLISGILPGYSQERNEKEVRIGVSAMISPKETVSYYSDLVNYIGEKLGRPAMLIQRRTYDEMNDLLERKYVTAAFVCSGPYVSAHKKFGLEIIAAPCVSGEALYYAYIIAHKNSGIKKFSQMRHKVFAFTDPASNTGRMVIVHMLAKIKETPETYFKSFIYTYSHDNSIKAVAEKAVDGASVDSLIYDYIKAKDPSGYIASTKVIEKSESFGIPPIVVHPDLNPELKTKLQGILFNMHKDEEGKKILAGIMIERFIKVDDSLYDSVRKMQE